MKRQLVNVGILCWLSVAAAPSGFAKMPVSTPAPAPGRTLDPTVGDEDPFPLACVDFSGSWRSDNGDKYAIQQHHCSQIKIAATYDGGDDGRETIMIVPDNRTRPGPVKGSQIRHRWNSADEATVLETHRSYVQDGNAVTEVTTIERANDNLLLQTTYRTIDCGKGNPPRHEYDQQVFRKMPQK
jgi:hypothetical protein